MNLKSIVTLVLIISAVFGFVYGFAGSLGDAYDFEVDNSTSGQILLETEELNSNLSNSYERLQNAELTSTTGFFTGINTLVSVGGTLIKAPFKILGAVFTTITNEILLPAWVVGFFSSLLTVMVIFAIFKMFSGRAD